MILYRQYLTHCPDHIGYSPEYEEWFTVGLTYRVYLYDFDVVRYLATGFEPLIQCEVVDNDGIERRMLLRHFLPTSLPRA